MMQPELIGLAAEGRVSRVLVPEKIQLKLPNVAVNQTRSLPSSCKKKLALDSKS